MKMTWNRGRVNPKPRRIPERSRAQVRSRPRRSRRSVADRVKSSEVPQPRPLVRLRVIGVVMALILSVMIVRLWSLQVIDSSAYSGQVTANLVREVEQPSERGEILGRDGQVMVGNQVSLDITLSRQAVQKYPDVVGALAALLGMSPATIQSTLDDPRYSPYLPVPILQNAPTNDVLLVQEYPNLYPGVAIQSDSQPTYPMGQTGAQALGYLREITPNELAANKSSGYQPGDEFGQDGLEAQYQSVLRGAPGVDREEVNAQGQVVGSLGETGAEPGDDLVTNIDPGLQQTLQSALDNEISSLKGTVDPSTGKVEHPTGGAAVAINPQNGAVMALVSSPTYDPTIWESNAISKAQYQAIQPALNDHAISGLYTPGSTFKLATATAALQTGLITPSTGYNDTGSFTIPGCATGGLGCNVLHDNDSANTGYMTVQKALTVSSDTFFYNLGAQFWIDYKNGDKADYQAIENVANAYGYGETTGIDLPNENVGRVDGPVVDFNEHKQNPKDYPDGSWGTGKNIEMAFGQGGTAITPLEQAVAYSTFANGGTRYAPQVAAGWVDPQSGAVVNTVKPQVVGHVDLSDSDRSAMLAGFEGVVQSPVGTAYSAFQGFPFSQLSLAGKTGTASATEQVPTSWFVGWGPVQNPTYLIAVVIGNGGYGASAAAPVARQGFQYLIQNPESAPVMKAPAVSPDQGGQPAGSTTQTTAPTSHGTSAIATSTTRTTGAEPNVGLSTLISPKPSTGLGAPNSDVSRADIGSSSRAPPLS